MTLFGFMLLLATGLGCGTRAGPVPLEHWTHRGGPYHWLGVRPVESHIHVKGRDVVACGRNSGTRCPSTPVFLMGCKASEDGVDAIALQGSLHFDALPGDPFALQIINPGAWKWFWKRRPYYESRVAVAVKSAGRPLVRFSATVTRERWAYSSNTAYEVAPLPIREIAEALSVAGNAVLEIEGSDISVRAVFALNGRTGQFLNACDL